mmetsp:Transcript_24850/g.38663  ORF Transcript_24850/g.38663 Transcript_24850/m.38663 type:complete len:109 (+) Transcript_24850:290-616(+)
MLLLSPETLRKVQYGGYSHWAFYCDKLPSFEDYFAPAIVWSEILIVGISFFNLAIVFFQSAEWYIMANIISAQKKKSVEEIMFEHNSGMLALASSHNSDDKTYKKKCF